MNSISPDIMKRFLVIFFIFSSFVSFANDNSKDDSWYDEARKYYYDYNVALEEYKNKNYTNTFSAFRVFPGAVSSLGMV